MRTVSVYNKESCGFSAQLGSLLQANDIPFEETNIKLDSTEHHEASSESAGITTLPQVFVGSVLLGGYEETLVADQAGMLDDRLMD